MFSPARLTRSVALLGLSAALLASTSDAGWLCPFCSAPSLTLSEQLAQADAAVLVQWASGEEPKRESVETTQIGDAGEVSAPVLARSVGTTSYEIIEVVRGPQDKLKKGDLITIPRYRAGKKGDLFLLLGTEAAEIEWSSPMEVSETSFNYMKQAPSPEALASQRLTYFVKFLEFPDSLIANDAYAEFANAPYKDITPIADEIPAEKVRAWVADPETAPTRLGLYGLLLGLAGNPADAKLMEAKILEPSEEFRLGIDGVMGGYLLLTGEAGLDLIDETKLQNTEIPFSETYAAMQALRFMWTYGNRIEKPRLRQSMRILLARPELADLVIADLARWKDWTVIDRLMEMYDAEEYGIPSIKRAIIRYMLVAAKDKPEEGADSSHVEKAEENLKALRDRDPKTVQQAERFFFVN
jgi:hypothetical protein